MKQYSEEEHHSENPIAPGTVKRYDFARYFNPSPSSNNFTTILEGTHALYHLFDFYSIQKSSKSPTSRSTVLLKDAQPQSPGQLLVTFHPRILRSDVIKIRPTSALGEDSRKRVKISLRGFLKSWEIRDVGPIIGTTITQPKLLGLPDGASLLWRLASDHKPMTMTLYSAGSWGTGAWSTILAQAFFSQSASTSHSAKLIAVETTEGIAEPLLIYIFISASIIESRLSRQQQAAREQQSLRKAQIPAWTVTPSVYGLLVQYNGPTG